jgi:aerobic carbon-monoxide dehydrogenase medium subunit
MDSVPVRAQAAERELVSAEAAGLDPAEVGWQAVNGTDPPADVHAGAAYRKKVGAAMVARALTEALREAGNA